MESRPACQEDVPAWPKTDRNAQEPTRTLGAGGSSGPIAREIRISLLMRGGQPFLCEPTRTHKNAPESARMDGKYKRVAPNTKYK